MALTISSSTPSAVSSINKSSSTEKFARDLFCINCRQFGSLLILIEKFCCARFTLDTEARGTVRVGSLTSRCVRHSDLFVPYFCSRLELAIGPAQSSRVRPPIFGLHGSGWRWSRFVLGVYCTKNSDDMKDCWKIEILRLRIAALIRIFIRTFCFLCCWKCRNGRCLRCCLPKSSRWASCKPVPRSSLHTFHQVCTFLLCVWNSFHCPRGLHSRVVREEMFVGFRGLAKPYSTDKSRICSTLPDSAWTLSTRMDTAARNSDTSANFISSPWYGFPKQSSNAVFLLPFTCQRISPTWATRPWWVSLPTSVLQTSNLTFHSVFSTLRWNPSAAFSLRSSLPTTSMRVLDRPFRNAFAYAIRWRMQRTSLRDTHFHQTSSTLMVMMTAH